MGLLMTTLAWSVSVTAATLPSDWQHEQPFLVPAGGLIKLSLPVETLDAARAGLEDLRLYDDAGGEVPYLIERPAPAGRISQGAKSFQVSLNPGSTVITIESGLPRPLDGVTLDSPSANFIKSVKIEGSSDGNRWQPLAQGLPIFRQPNGAGQLHLSFPPGAWGWLRLTVDDQRSQPVPFTGAFVHMAAGETAPGESLPVTISERDENPGETRLTLNLGAANLNIAAIHIETAEPLFTRQVTLAVPQILEDSVREQTVAQSYIYRIALEGLPVSSNLTVSLGNVVRSRELLLLIRNQDSPPLPITAVRAERRPVYLVFLARQTGTYHLLSGNTRCSAPSYDLAALGANLKSVPAQPIPLPAPADNPNYRPPEVLSGVEEQGAALDVSAWKFRKAVKLSRSGAQQVELDLDALARAQPGFDDLRLVRGGKQLPYILERTSISRSLVPTVAATNDTKHPTLSRWILKLPQPNLPVTRLSSEAQTALFERQLTLHEEIPDERGEPYGRLLASGSWVQTPERKRREFFLTLDASPRSDTLFLETQNGDNPPIAMEKFQLFYPASRLLFKAKADDEIFLYYGNPEAPPPRYDLSLVADQLLTADKTAASLSAQEQLKKSSWRDNPAAGKGGVLFWGILALVVIVLLILIARLLPKAPPPAA